MSIWTLNKKLAQKDDIETLLDIKAESFNKDFHKNTSLGGDRDYLLRSIENDKSTVYLYLLGNQTIGYSVTEMNSSSAEIDIIGVRERYQGKGYGSRILKECLKDLGDCEKVKIVVDPKNTQAIFTYLKNGFVIKGYVAEYYGINQDRVIMFRQLSSGD